MSTLRVHKISNRTEDGPVEFTNGAVLPAEKQILDENGASALRIASVGVVTATSFAGDGSGITGIPGGGVLKGVAIGLMYLS